MPHRGTGGREKSFGRHRFLSASTSQRYNMPLKSGTVLLLVLLVSTVSGSCRVDLSQAEGLSLHINEVRPDSACVMKVNSSPVKSITVTTNSDLTFQGCLPEDVEVTATRSIEYSRLQDRTPMNLTVPQLPSCLPANLSRITWTFRLDRHRTVVFAPPDGFLRQLLPEQPCDGGDVIEMTEESGPTIGHFCPQGAIEKVLIHTNVSVTWRPGVRSQTPRSPQHVLNATFENEIAERYTFWLAPSRDNSVIVGTPGWPAGMRSEYTVSWIVSVPSSMKALLTFTQADQPKCSNGHTNVIVQRIGRREEDHSWREDEQAPKEITVLTNFYLNMSNCSPERGQFRVLTKITLQWRMYRLLTIILSSVAALLVIFAIVLAVVCVMARKKKKSLTEQVGIYNSEGTHFLPGLNGLPKTNESSDSPVYASIDDAMVYSHLLKQAKELGIYDPDHSFPGNGDSQRAVVSNDNGGEVHRLPRPGSEQGPPLPNRPPSHIRALENNDMCQREEESCPDLGSRLEPEGED